MWVHRQSGALWATATHAMTGIVRGSRLEVDPSVLAAKFAAFLFPSYLQMLWIEED